MDHCRNCGSENLKELGFVGTLAPFFLKRVLRAESTIRKSNHPRKRAIQNLTQSLHKIFSRIHPPVVAVQLQSCLNCSFVQTKYPFSEEGIGRLYVDYRSESYNRERSHYEPQYSQIATLLGDHREGGLGRIEALTLWLSSKVDLTGADILDYGGADGKYLPDLPCKKFVYEISDVSPAPGVTRISDESALQTYGYIQLSHVLEHVTEPLQMVRHVASLLQPGGYLLIEVPQDKSLEFLEQLQTGSADVDIQIHEHINIYSPQAVQKLVEAIPLELIALEAIPVVSPLASQPYIRALARRGVNEPPKG